MRLLCNLYFLTLGFSSSIITTSLSVNLKVENMRYRKIWAKFWQGNGLKPLLINATQMLPICVKWPAARNGARNMSLSIVILLVRISGQI